MATAAVVMSRLAEWARGRAEGWVRRGHLMGELNRLAQERAFGIVGRARAEEELARLAGGREPPHEMWRAMMARLDLEPERMREAPEVVRELRHVCAACAEHPQCARWLFARVPRESHHVFCRNAALFDAMLSRVPMPALPARFYI